MSERIVFYICATIMFLVALFVAVVARADEFIDELVPIICLVESNNDPKAFNEDSCARGIMQITDICLMEYNLNNEVPFTREQMFDKEINIKVGTWYLNKIKDHYLRAEIEKLLEARRNVGNAVVLATPVGKLTVTEYIVAIMAAAYNMGPHRLDDLNYQWWELGETARYVRKVLRNW